MGDASLQQSSARLGPTTTRDDVIEQARRAGATIGREPAETFWDGYSGLFIDPSGHPWEVAHKPGWTINDDGTITAGTG